VHQVGWRALSRRLEGDVSEGEPFVNPMAAYLAQTGLAQTRPGDIQPEEAEPSRHRQGVVGTRSLIEIVAAVVISAILAFMVIRGVDAAGQATRDDPFGHVDVVAQSKGDGLVG
jgi:hypothetical protein